MPEPIDDALTGEVTAFAAELGSCLTGIADAGSLNEALEPDFRPEDVLPGCRAVVVMSLHVPDGSLEIMRRGKTNYSYNLFGYAYLNRELDFLAYRMSNFLEGKGYATVPVPARNCAIGARKPSYGMISFRHAAVAAGLASFGLSGIALTPEYGGRQRFIALPTTAPLRPAEAPPAQAEVCDGCLECLRQCPAGALTLAPPHQCVIGGRTYQYAECDPDLCREMSAGLSTRVWEGAAFNPVVDVPRIENPTAEEKYDQAWNQRDARIRLLEHSEATFGATHCGRCQVFCASGHAAMKRRLRPEEQDRGYADDLVIHKDGSLRPLRPEAKKLGRELLGKI